MNSVAASWLLVEVLAARLDGKWLKSAPASKRERHCPSLSRNGNLSDGFCAQWPEHTNCYTRPPLTRTAISRRGSASIMGHVLPGAVLRGAHACPMMNCDEEPPGISEGGQGT